MNYKNIAIRTLEEFANENPNMTLSQILYSVLREKNSGFDRTNDILNIDDEQLYTIIDKAKEFEKE